jgi:hypothetical protein
VRIKLRVLLAFVTAVSLAIALTTFARQVAEPDTKAVVSYQASSDWLSLGIGMRSDELSIERGVPIQLHLKNLTDVEQKVVSDSAVMVGSYEIKVSDKSGKHLEFNEQGKRLKMRASALISARVHVLKQSEEIVVAAKLSDLFDLSPGEYWLEVSYAGFQHRVQSPRICFNVTGS